MLLIQPIGSLVLEAGGRIIITLEYTIDLLYEERTLLDYLYTQQSCIITNTPRRLLEERASGTLEEYLTQHVPPPPHLLSSQLPPLQPPSTAVLVKANPTLSTTKHCPGGAKSCMRFVGIFISSLTDN